MASFRFTLRDNNGSETFGTEMVRNWDAIKTNMTRHDTYRGVMRKYTGTIEFCRDIRRRLIRLVDKYGAEAEVWLKIEVGNDNRERKSFTLLGGTELKADMTTMDVTDITIAFNFVASGFEEVLMNRHDNDVQYATTKSIDGVTIPTFAHETQQIKLHDRVLELNSQLRVDTTALNVDLQVGFNASVSWITSIPLTTQHRLYS